MKVSCEFTSTALATAPIASPVTLPACSPYLRKKRKTFEVYDFQISLKKVMKIAFLFFIHWPLLGNGETLYH